MQEPKIILKRYQGFFLDYQDKFSDNFVKIAGTIAPAVIPPQDLRRFAQYIFLSFRSFAEPYEIERPGFIPIRTADLKKILVKAFYVMTSDFAHYHYRLEESLQPLKALTLTAEEFLTELEQAFSPDETDNATPELHGDHLQESIMNTFQVILRHRKDIRMLSVFKGVTISFSVVLVSVNRELVQCLVHKNQIASLRLENEAYFISDAFPKTVKGRIHNLSPEDLLADFTNFRFVDSSPENRNAIRVQPEQSVDVSLYHKDQKILGSLLDVSLSGMCIAHQSNAQLEAERYVEIYLKLELNPRKKPVDVFVKGKIIRLNERKPKKLVVRIYPDTMNEAYISQYIAHRQISIIREMRVLE